MSRSMSRSMRKSIFVSAIILGALALVVLPGTTRAGDISIPAPPSGPIVIEPTPAPELPPADPPSTEPPVGIYPPPEAPVECGEIVIQPVPGPCDPPVDNPPVGTNPPPADPPVGVEPPPAGRVGELRLWIERRGQPRRAVAIDCVGTCSVARYLLRLSARPADGKCRARRGTVRAGGSWRAQRIGIFHNRNACAARVWRQAAPIYNRLAG